jgi:hypothetical protein
MPEPNIHDPSHRTRYVEQFHDYDRKDELAWR